MNEIEKLEAKKRLATILASPNVMNANPSQAFSTAGIIGLQSPSETIGDGMKSMVDNYGLAKDQQKKNDGSKFKDLLKSLFS